MVGFDDLPVARWVGPPLTTVRQPLTEMAEAAAKLVLDLGKGEDSSTATRVELATSLVVRSSTAAAGGALVNGPGCSESENSTRKTSGVRRLS